MGKILTAVVIVMIILVIGVIAYLVSTYKPPTPLLLFVSIGYGIYALYHMYADTYEITGKVVKTWIDPVDGGSAYLVKIKLTDGTLKMLEVKKNFMFNGVNEDLLFSSVEVNKTYTFKCWGWDMMYVWVFATYWYPNVIAVQEVS